MSETAEGAIERREPSWVGTARRCTAHTSKGKPCRAPAIRGGFVCVKHGGAAPQVKLAAARREANWEQLQDAVPVAIGRLRREVMWGENSAAAVRASAEILDRTGYVHRAEEDDGDVRELLIRVRERVGASRR
jgi:hypothetical protein